MRYQAAKLMTSVLLAFVCAQATLSGLTDKPASSFNGTWEGAMNDQPAVEVTVRSNGERVAGSITFYFQRLGADGKWHVEGDNQPQQMIDPKVEGGILTFEVLHHKRHGSQELGPNKKFRLELTGANEARLCQAGDAGDIPGSGLKLTRRTSLAPR